MTLLHMALEAVELEQLNAQHSFLYDLIFWTDLKWWAWLTTFSLEKASSTTTSYRIVFRMNFVGSKENHIILAMFFIDPSSSIRDQ